MSYEMACEFLGQTDNAVKIRDPATGEELWIPLSQVDELHGITSHNRGSGTIVMSDWIAQKKGLL